ncbi:uncharacterized protein LOC129226463 [Uloborus diversus]|uniref:uncharacterized protein LOC129226307 n=1 Tax=Uloborus diversus TaxID=327109 RepID=UPI002409836F|nr:uncharacterized protein LOC129226307 [Uloborus diversus]XP_054717045.1 uncharacterized protein LOC129226462 [Uloborus diversus]XP_054717046.1 uncharacterized protein LOC129226463 [Uloborus diversus]
MFWRLVFFFFTCGIILGQVLQAPRTIFDDIYEYGEFDVIEEDIFDPENDEATDLIKDIEDFYNDEFSKPFDVPQESTSDISEEEAAVFLVSDYIDLLPNNQFILFKLFLSNIGRNESNFMMDDYQI